jgi:hypothetical protein
MFEHRRDPLLPRSAYLRRLMLHGGLAAALIFAALSLGVAGYSGLEGLPFVDALENAAMILGGMGPVNQLMTTGGKLFAAFYALFSGLVFLVVISVLLAPVMHRSLHRFHLEGTPEERDSE